MMWHVDILNIYQKYKQSMTKHYVIRHFTLLVIYSMPDINVDWRQCSTNSLKRRLKKAEDIQSTHTANEI